MRYYYYGDETDSVREKPVYAMHVEKPERAVPNRPADRDLVIEEDTIYEVDRECLRCRQQKNKNNQ